MTTAIGRPTTRSSSGVERYTLRIAVTDALVIIWAVIGAQLVRFGTSSGEADGPQTSTFGLDYALVAVVLIVLWLVALRVHNAYDPRLFGHGPEEYRAVATATVRLFATLAIISYLFKLELARGFLLVALPFGLAGLFLARWIWRRWLGAQRAEGRLCDAMVVVGDRGHLAGLIAALALALYQVFARNSLADRNLTILCVIMMSVPTVLYIIWGVMEIVGLPIAK